MTDLVGPLGEDLSAPRPSKWILEGSKGREGNEVGNGKVGCKG